MSTSFAQILTLEIGAVQRFVSLLNEEKAALSRGRLEDLELIVAEKEQLAEDLERIGKEREACLEQAGIDRSEKAISDWLAQQPDVRAAQCWQKLQTLAREARTLNELNGQCIMLLARNNKQILDALTGKAGKSDDLYGSDGRSVGGGARFGWEV
jgi:flagella synthesis protein FlgN